jgi:hypothetical protein
MPRPRRKEVSHHHLGLGDDVLEAVELENLAEEWDDRSYEGGRQNN